MEKDMDDNSIMPFGKHQGEKLANVPGSYLIYMYEQGYLKFGLKTYVEDNMDVLQDDMSEEQHQKFKKIIVK